MGDTSEVLPEPGHFDAAGPKEVSVKDAREALEGIISALESDQNIWSIQSALREAEKDRSMVGTMKDPNGKDLPNLGVGEKYRGNLRMQALGPVLEQITRPITEKYGFSSFVEAMASISQHEEETDIAMALSPLRSLITGAPPAHRTVGKIEEFGELALEFATAANDEERKKVINELVKPLIAKAQADADTKAEAGKPGKLEQPLMKFYLKVMEKSLEEGRVVYVAKQIERLAKLVQNDKTPKKQRSKFAKQINILSSFLTPNEHRDLVEKKHIEREKLEKAEEARRLEKVSAIKKRLQAEKAGTTEREAEL